MGLPALATEFKEVFDQQSTTAAITAATVMPSEDIADTAIITTVTASDADGQNIEYSLDAANNDADDLELFEINATTGVIRLKAGQSLDYETAQSHSLTVTATAVDTPGAPPVLDALKTATLAVTITVTDVDDAPSVYIDGSGAASPLAVTVNEGAEFSIDGDYLRFDDVDTLFDGEPDETAIVYTIKSLPQYGELRLNGTALQIGDWVTQSECE